MASIKKITISNLLSTTSNYDNWDFYMIRTPLVYSVIDPADVTEPIEDTVTISLQSLNGILVSNFKPYTTTSAPAPNTDGYFNYDCMGSELGSDLETWDLINQPRYLKDETYAYILLRGRFANDEQGAIVNYFKSGVDPNLGGAIEFAFTSALEINYTNFDNMDLDIIGFNNITCDAAGDSDSDCPNYQMNTYRTSNCENIDINNIS